MEKWQLAGIISNGTKPALILPPTKLKRRIPTDGELRKKNKMLTTFRTAMRRLTEVIALF